MLKGVVVYKVFYMSFYVTFFNCLLLAMLGEVCPEYVLWCLREFEMMTKIANSGRRLRLMSTLAPTLMLHVTYTGIHIHSKFRPQTMIS